MAFYGHPEDSPVQFGPPRPSGQLDQLQLGAASALADPFGQLKRQLSGLTDQTMDALIGGPLSFAARNGLSWMSGRRFIDAGAPKISLDKVPLTKNIQQLEERWGWGTPDNALHGPEVADHRRQAADLIQQLPSYKRYFQGLVDQLHQHLGPEFNVFRTMPREELTALQEGRHVTPMATSLGQGTAEHFRNMPYLTDPVTVQIRATPSDVIMRGTGLESELVLDPRRLSPARIKPIK